jgi:hypothetical protein
MQFNAAMRQVDDTLKLAGSFSSRAARDLEHLMDGPGGLARKLGRMSQWRKVPDRYLAYLYGIAPLAGDLENAFEQLSLMNERGFGLNVVLRANLKSTETLPPYPVNLNNARGGHVQGHLRGTRKIGCRVGYRFDIPGWYLERSAMPLTPFSQAYELTRMSFVWDWFIPVGDWIGAMESCQYSPFFKEGWEVSKVVDTYNQVVPDTYWNKTIAVNVSGRQVCGAMVRSPVETWSVLNIAPPAINPTPSWSKAAQGLSLLTQAFKRWY